MFLTLTPILGWRLSVKVGDLIKFNKYIGLIIEVNEWETLVQWACDGEIEDISNYSSTSVRVINESR